MRVLGAALLVLGALLHAGPTQGFDSVCYRPDGTACGHGPDAARHRWIGFSDEHRQLWELARQLAGLPVAASEPFTLDVFTSGDPVFDSGDRLTDEPLASQSFNPVGFGEAADVVRRTMSAGEFAQLPDHSYALWDWVRGNETCPPGASAPVTGPATATKCHEFRTHMGQVNSNHFLPQAQHFYRHYHELALGRARACKTMRERVAERGGDPGLFQTFLRECEQQALVLEAVGHHFLQDAWSTGHMWERWGSPDQGDFASPLHAQLVAMTTGLIHGANAVLRDAEGSDDPLPDELDPTPDGGPSRFVKYSDAMCAPQPEVRWVGPDHAEAQPGVGDLYLADLLAGETLPPSLNPPASLVAQQRRLLSCAVSGILEVYEASGAQHGPATPQSTLVALESVIPTSAACFGQRATNLAMARGAGVDYLILDADLNPVDEGRYDLNPFTVTLLVVGGGSALVPIVLDPFDALGVRYYLGLVELMATIKDWADRDPSGTQLASGAIGSLIGVETNREYVKTPLAPYVDPPLAPELPTTGPEGERATWIARAFHQAHATDWCDRFAPGAAEDLAALRQRAKDLAAGGTTGPVLEAACGACAEFAARAHRRGSDESDFDPNDPPLCYLIAGDPDRVQYAYQDGAGENAALAAWWCGCPASVEIEADFGGSGEPASITASHTSTARGGTVSGRVRVTDAAGRVAYPAGVLVEVSGIGAGGGSGETDDEGRFEIGVDVAGGPREVTFDVVARAESGGRVLAETRIRATIDDDDDDDDDDDPEDECEDFRPDGVYLEKRSSIAAGNTIASYFPTPAGGSTFIYQVETYPGSPADQLRKRTDLPGASIDRYFGSWTGTASRSGSGSRSGITSSGSFSAGHTSEMQGQPVTLQYPGGDPYDGFLFQGFTFQATAATTVNHTNSGTLRAESSSVANGATCVEFSVVGKPATFSIASDLGPGTYVEFDGSPCAEDGESFYRYYINEAMGFPPGTVEGDLTRAGLLQPGGYQLCVSLTAQSRIATNAPAGGQPNNPSDKNHSLELTFTVQ